MKKVLLLTLSGLIAIIIISLLTCGNDEENRKREKMAIAIRGQIEEYFNQNRFYPASIAELPLSKDREFISYYKGKVFRYSSSREDDKPWYRLTWVYDGILREQDSNHGLSWSGKQCGSDISRLHLLSHGSQPDANGFYEIDLH